LAERRGSKNKYRPNSTRADEYGLSAGQGTGGSPSGDLGGDGGSVAGDVNWLSAANDTIPTKTAPRNTTGFNVAKKRIGAQTRPRKGIAVHAILGLFQ